MVDVQNMCCELDCADLKLEPYLLACVCVW